MYYQKSAAEKVIWLLFQVPGKKGLKGGSFLP